ncbi:MAG: hypothetical protein LW850_33810 [Planctomycetaceae bacterium]|jgi:hypothetical protein|nr:hypothetical protein [Planctomycetaceae bacterium]
MADKIPDFDENGLLPVGDYEVTLTELRASILVRGPRDRIKYPNWDAIWRLWLVDPLEMMVNQLWTVGVRKIYINGSFVEDKDHPNDIDGYFVCDRGELASGRLVSALNRLDPQKVWTWDPSLRRPYAGYPKKQLPMWHVYRVELYPHFPGLNSGICDKFGNELEFPAAFRQCRRDSTPKGIVKLKRELKS